MHMQLLLPEASTKTSHFPARLIQFKTETIGNATAAPGDEAAFGPVDCDVILRSGLARFMFEPKKEY